MMSAPPAAVRLFPSRTTSSAPSSRIILSLSGECEIAMVSKPAAFAYCSARSLPTSLAPQGLRSHPSLRLHSQPKPRRPATTMLRCSPSQYHRKTNRKRRPLLQRTRCGAVPTAAGRWLSSNDSPRHNSNSDLHRSWPRLHEVTRPHTALSARYGAPRRSVSPLQPDVFFPSLPRLTYGYRLLFAQAHRLLLHLAGRLPRTSTNPFAPFNLHKSRVRRASGFLLTAFSNATPHTLSSPCASFPRRVRKSTSVTRPE